MRLTNTAEGGTDEVTVSVANSGGTSGTAWDTVSIGTSGVCVYDTATAAHGSYSIRQSTGGTSASVQLQWAASIGTPTRLYGRIYFRFASLAVSRDIFRVRSSSNNQVARVDVLATTGQLRLRNGANTVVATSTAGISVDTWYRVEWDIQPGASVTNEVRWFLGDSVTPIETLSASSSYSTDSNVAQLHVGNLFGQTNLANAWFDSVDVNDVGYPGPWLQTLSPAGVAATASTGAATVEPGTATLNPAGVPAAAETGAPAVTATATLQPAGVDVQSQTGPVAVTPSAVTVAPAGVAQPVTTGGITVTPGTATVAPAGVDSSTTTGPIAVTAGAVVVSPAGVDAPALTGAVVVTPGTVTLNPAGVLATATPGPLAVQPGAATINPAGVHHPANTGPVTVTVGATPVPGRHIATTTTAATHAATTSVATLVANTAQARLAVTTNP